MNNRVIFLVLVFVLAVGLSCGFDRGEPKDTSQKKSEKSSGFVPDTAEILANIPDSIPEKYRGDWIEIQQTLSEAIERIKYKDKTALYDLELNYLYNEYDFDKYLTHGWVKAAESDSIESITVKSIKFFDRDSAKVTDVVVFNGPIQGHKEVSNHYMMYYQRNKWLRPTVSYMKRQLLLDSAKAAEGN